MSASKHLDKICGIVLCFTLILTFLFMNAEHLGVSAASTTVGYENRLFDTSRVHTIDIVMDDWDGFLETCTDEEYASCAVVIDGEAYKNVAIRAKGNTSLSQVASYGNDRYSFKIEFDHYDSTKSYHGLDKLCLNNIIQDNTYMKDYLVYQMMGQFGVAAPLCSYVYITVNGDDFGLYLAVEAVEDAFLARNYGYGSDGDLYKPDSMSMGGGRGNGKAFDQEKMEELFENFDFDSMEHWKEQFDRTMPSATSSDASRMYFPDSGNVEMPEEMTGTGFSGGFDGADFDFSGGFDDADFDFSGGFDGADFDFSGGFGGADFNFSGDFDGKHFGGDFGGGMSMGSDDVTLIYTDDNYDSYSNIFNNAKTTVTEADKDRLISSLKKLNEQTELETAVNIEDVIRYFVVHNFAVNFDSYTGSMIHNYYLYEENGIMEMIPWDYNLAFGGFMSSSDATSLVNYPIDDPVSGGTTESRPMLAWIFADEAYTELYHTCFSEFLALFFESGLLEDMIDTVSTMIAPYIETQPKEFCTYEEFETGVATLKEFCLLRAESIEGQLNGSISSTSDGQTADRTSRIDASHVSISAMGTMNMGPVNQNNGSNSPFQPDSLPDGDMPAMAFPGNFSPAEADKQQNPDEKENAKNPSFSEATENAAPSHSRPFSEKNNKTDSSGFDSGQPSAAFPADNANSSAILLLVISFLVLVIGLVFAVLYGKKRPFSHRHSA